MYFEIKMSLQDKALVLNISNRFPLSCFCQSWFVCIGHFPTCTMAL